MASFSSYTPEECEQISKTLRKVPGPEYMASRPGMGASGNLYYIEGHKLISLANQIFGFNGWSSEVRRIEADSIEKNRDGRWSCMYTAVVRVSLKDGSFREDVGTGTADNMKLKHLAMEKAKKEAVTDGIKRAMRQMGHAMGGYLYDKHITNQLRKMKYSTPAFDESELIRNPAYTNLQPRASDAAAPKAATAAAEALQPSAVPSAPVPAPAHAPVNFNDLDLDSDSGSDWYDEGVALFEKQKMLAEAEAAARASEQIEVKEEKETAMETAAVLTPEMQQPVLADITNKLAAPGQAPPKKLAANTPTGFMSARAAEFVTTDTPPPPGLEFNPACQSPVASRLSVPQDRSAKVKKTDRKHLLTEDASMLGSPRPLKNPRAEQS